MVRPDSVLCRGALWSEAVMECINAFGEVRGLMRSLEEGMRIRFVTTAAEHSGMVLPSWILRPVCSLSPISDFPVFIVNRSNQKTSLDHSFDLCFALSGC